MISPDTRQNVTRLRSRQDNFQQQILSAVSWDISALDFVDVQIGRSLRELAMKIESRQMPGQQLFHLVDETWNQNGFHLAYFPNVEEAEARAMMMSLIPFLVHHCNDSAIKWFLSSTQRRAAGASWDPKKGCVKTVDNEAVSWMMTEKGFSAFDQAAPAKDSPAAQRPDPSHLQAASGASGLINDQDLVGMFFSKTTLANASGPSSSPAPLNTGAAAIPNQRVLPHATDSVTDSVNSKSTRTSITASLFSRLSQMESTLAKVDKLDMLMTCIVNQLGLLQDSAVTPNPSCCAAIPAPPAALTQALLETVNVPLAPAVPVSQSDPAMATVANTPSKPDDARPLTYEGVLSNPRILAQNRQSSSEQISADVSNTDVGQAG
jgi:hypothetical protein